MNTGHRPTSTIGSGEEKEVGATFAGTGKGLLQLTSRKGKPLVNSASLHHRSKRGRDGKRDHRMNKNRTKQRTFVLLDKGVSFNPGTRGSRKKEKNHDRLGTKKTHNNKTPTVPKITPHLHKEPRSRGCHASGAVAEQTHFLKKRESKGQVN